MTLEKLLDFNLDKLEAMTNDELLAFWQPMLKVTRPELAEKPTNFTPKQKMKQQEFDQKNILIKELEARGMGHVAALLKKK